MEFSISLTYLSGVFTMKYLFISLKGGVGKTAISTNLAAYLRLKYVTNDLSSFQHSFVELIKPNKKRIPNHLLKEPDIVFDFGALSTKIDPKVTQVLKLCDVVVIPTRPDPRSIQATIETYHFVKSVNKPIVILINHVRDERKYEVAKRTLIEQLGSHIPLFKIRETTLFDRVATDGIDWLAKVGHEYGEYQLNKTKLLHEAIYDEIVAIGEKQ